MYIIMRGSGRAARNPLTISHCIRFCVPVGARRLGQTDTMTTRLERRTETAR